MRSIHHKLAFFAVRTFYIPLCYSVNSSTLIVGDAGADILAAKAMGADFCAVLTGVQGERARPYFEKLNAEYILNSVLEFTE